MALTRILASMMSFIQAGAGAVVLTVQDYLRERVSITQFGAKGDGVTSASAALGLAIATGKAVRIPRGDFLIDVPVVTDASNVVILGDSRTGSRLLTTTADFPLVMGTTAVLAKGGLRIEHITIQRLSGSWSGLKVCENLGAVIRDNAFVGFSDYGLNIERSDGALVNGNLFFMSSIKAYSEMDRLIISENDIQAAPNKPGIEVYGGMAVTIEKNFVNWGQHEALVVGYDSARGDFTNSLTIRGNYFERGCRAVTADTNRPMVHIGAPRDQNGAAYTGGLVVLFTDVTGNYFNGDAGNENKANIVPILFERAVEVNWGPNRVLNFPKGLDPRVKWPAQAVHLGNHNTKYVDLSVSGKSAYQQVLYDALSFYRSREVYLGEVTVPTDAGGNGAYTFTNIDTGANGLDPGRISVQATPTSDFRTNVPLRTVAAGAAQDGSDYITWRVNVTGGPVSSSVQVMVRAAVTSP